MTLRSHWPRIRALLAADLTHRAGRLTDGGPTRLFADLHDGVTWAGDRLEIATVYDETLPLRRPRPAAHPVRVHLAPVRDHDRRRGSRR